MDLNLVRKNIRDVRHERKMTQAQLAEKIGMSEVFVGDIERGTRGITLKTLVKIANALKVPASRLIPSNKDIEIAKIMEKIKDLTPKQQDALMKFVDTLYNNE